MRAGRYGEDGARFAPDAVYETPFGLPGQPRRFDGTEAINAHFAARMADPLAMAGTVRPTRAGGDAHRGVAGQAGLGGSISSMPMATTPRASRSGG